MQFPITPEEASHNLRPKNISEKGQKRLGKAKINASQIIKRLGG